MRSYNYNRKGLSLVWMMIGLSTLIIFVSIAVDYGRVQIAKTELRRGADAAARAATAYLGDSTQATSAATATALLNNVDGTGLVLTPATDVEFGWWNDVNRTFTPMPTTPNGANSVRITARRTSATGNAISLNFAKVLGVNTCDVNAQSIACQAPLQFVIFGINSLIMGGNAVDSYWSASGTGIISNGGNIGSNGDITINGTSLVHGNAHPGPGHTVTGASNVTGSTTPLPSTLTFTNGTSGAYSATNNDNGLLPAGTVSAGSYSDTNKAYTIPGGNYYVKDWTLGSSASLSFLGPVTFYCYGTVNLKGDASTYNNQPKNFNVIMVPDPNTGSAPGSVTLASGSQLYATVYAPQSDVKLSASADLFGSLIGKTISMTGGSAIHYDLSALSNSGIAIVK